MNIIHVMKNRGNMSPDVKPEFKRHQSLTKKFHSYAMLIGALLFLSPLFGLHALLQAQQMWVTGVYPKWAVGQAAQGRMGPTEMSMAGLTDIVWFADDAYYDPVAHPGVYLSALALPQDSIDLLWGGGYWPSNPLVPWADSMIHVAHRAGVRVELDIAGTFNGSQTGKTAWNNIALDSARGDAFARQCVLFAKRHGFDGIDLDWEPPSSRAAFSQQLRAFRKYLDMYIGSSALGGHAMLLVDAANEDNNNNYSPYDLSVIAANVDQFNLMMYDYEQWPIYSGHNVTGFNAPLHRPGTQYPVNHAYSEYFDSPTSGPRLLASLGLSKSKIGMGMPFYGNTFVGKDGPDQATQPYVMGLTPYAQVVDELSSGGIYHWDDSTKTPWIGGTATKATGYGGYVPSGNKFFCTYEDTMSLRYKIQWAKQMGWGGVYIFELWQGWLSSKPAGQRDPLLKAVVNTINAVPPPPDNIIPTVSLTSPANGASVSGTVTLSANAADNVGVARVEFYINGVLLGSDLLSPYSFAWVTNGLTGSRTISAKAYDVAGNVGVSASVAVTVIVPPPDTSKPTVVFTSPVNGSTVSGIVSLLATAADNIAVSKVEFLVNGSVVGSDTTSPYAFSWNATGLTGNQTIVARAYDAAGNVGSSAPISVTVTTSTTVDQWLYQDAVQSPWIDVSWNSTNTYASVERAYAGTKSVKVVQTAWGGLALRSGSYATPVSVNTTLYSKVEFVVYNTTPGLALNVLFTNDAGQTFPGVQQSNVPLNQWTIVSIPMAQLNPNGYAVNQITIQNFTSLTPTYFLDNIRFVGNGVVTIPPAPSLASPANGAANQLLTPTLSWSASAGATSYRLQVSSGPAFSSFIINDSTLTAPSALLTGLTYSSAYYWRVNAKNVAGTSAYSATWSFTTRVPADTTKPVVIITAPVNGATVSGVVPLAATASDNVGVTKIEFLVNGAIIGSDTTSPFAFSWNTAALTGNQVLTAKAYDAAGNVTTSPAVTVTIKPPTTADKWIYQDAVQSPWSDVSWNSTNTYGSTARVYAGSASIKAVQTAWGGVSLHSGLYGAPVAVNPALYSRFEFAVYNTTAGLDLNVLFMNDAGQTFPSVQQFNLPVNQWSIVSIPMALLDPTGFSIHRIIIQNYTSVTSTYYLDNIRFVGNAPVNPPSETDPASITAFGNTPISYALEQNFPNPFNPTTTINYSLPDEARVSIRIYNMLGEEVAVLVNRVQTAGYQSATWDGSRLSSGAYFCRLEATSTSTNQTFTQIRRMLLVK